MWNDHNHFSVFSPYFPFSSSFLSTLTHLNPIYLFVASPIIFIFFSISSPHLCSLYLVCCASSLIICHHFFLSFSTMSIILHLLFCPSIVSTYFICIQAVICAVGIWSLLTASNLWEPNRIHPSSKVVKNKSATKLAQMFSRKRQGRIKSFCLDKHWHLVVTWKTTINVEQIQFFLQ